VFQSHETFHVEDATRTQHSDLGFGFGFGFTFWV